MSSFHHRPRDIPWSRLMDLRCRTWRDELGSDPNMALRRGPFPSLEKRETTGTSVFVLVYEKLADPSRTESDR